MRNLKRALSLALASVMVLGLMVVGSGASYKDVSSEQNQEAIEVLQAVGIMVGDDNGNFNPEAKVTRNEMAVVMSNLMDYRVASYAGTSPFTDVPAWAEPYVAACWTNGITKGYTATTYGGSDTVTTAQAALMLMKALGYFQYESDFEDDWQLATVKQANKIDLFEDVDSGVQEAMTRNDVAQLVLNTLEAGIVEADDNTIKVETDGTKVEAGKVSYNYVTSSKDYAYAISWDEATSSTSSTKGAIVELGEKLYNGDLTKDSYARDDFGRPAAIWEYQAKKIGTFAEKADYTYTAKVTSKVLYSAIGKTAVDSYDWTVSFNGDTVDYDGANLAANKNDDDADFVKKAGGAELTGNGTLTQVYVDGTYKTVDIAIIEYYAAEVYEVKESDGTITLTDLQNGPADNNDEFTTSEFEEDQIVMYSFAGNEIQEVYAAEKMSGEVTRVRANTADSNGDNFVVDGNTYKYNKTTVNDRLVTDSVNNDVVAYLDAYGYVAYIDESAVTYDYAYVLSMGSDSSIYGGSATYYARLVLTDGTMIKVETDESGTSKQNHIVSYSKDKNDVYSLTLKDTDSTANKTTGTNGVQAAASSSALEIENGVASFTDPTNAGFVANSNTVFILADSDTDYDDYDFAVYTGVKNVPDVTGKTGAKVAVAADEDKVAKVVYIEDADVSGSGDVIFIRTATDAKVVKDSDGNRYYEVNAVVDGKAVTLKVKDGSDAYDTLVARSNSKYSSADKTVISTAKSIVAAKSITVNSDDLVTSVKLYDSFDGKDGTATGTATGKVERETVGLNGARYAYDSDVVVVRYNYKGDFEVSRISSIKDDYNDDVLFVRDDKVVTGICIVEADGTGSATPTTPETPSVVEGYTTHVSKVDGTDIYVNAVAAETAGNKQQTAIAYLRGQDYTDIQAVSNTSLKATKDGVVYTFTIQTNEAKAITYTNSMGGEWTLEGDEYAANGDKVTVVVSHPAWSGTDAGAQRTFSYTGAAVGNSGAKLPSNHVASFEVTITDNTAALTVTVA